MSEQFKILSFVAREKNTLRGFLDVATPSGLIIHGLSLHEKNDSRWVAMPARQFEKDGETSWTPVLEFSSRGAADEFRDLVLEALDRFQVPAERRR